MNKYRTTLLILIAAVTLLSLPASSAQREEKRRAKKVQKEETTGKEMSKQKVQSNKIPEGATVKGNKVTLKTGYTFVRQSGGGMGVEKKAGGVVIGKVVCYCLSASQPDDCSLSVKNNTAVCTTSGGGCRSCFLELIDVTTSAPPTQIKR